MQAARAHPPLRQTRSRHVRRQVARPARHRVRLTLPWAAAWLLSGLPTTHDGSRGLELAKRHGRPRGDWIRPVEQIVRELNGFLRGWVGYFRYGNSTQAFDKIRHHAINRLAILLARRRGLPPSYGWKMIVDESPDRIGLFDSGCVVSPRPIWGLAPDAECRR
jgi:hypothetical protein